MNLDALLSSLFRTAETGDRAASVDGAQPVSSDVSGFSALLQTASRAEMPLLQAGPGPFCRPAAGIAETKPAPAEDASTGVSGTPILPVPFVPVAGDLEGAQSNAEPPVLTDGRRPAVAAAPVPELDIRPSDRFPMAAGPQEFRKDSIRPPAPPGPEITIQLPQGRESSTPSAPFAFIDGLDSPGGTRPAMRPATEPLQVGPDTASGRFSAESVTILPVQKSEASPVNGELRQAVAGIAEEARSMAGLDGAEAGSRQTHLRASGLAGTDAEPLSEPDLHRGMDPDGTAEDGDPSGRGRRQKSAEDPRSTAASEMLRSAASTAGENRPADALRSIQTGDMNGVEAEAEFNIKEAGNQSERAAGRIESGGAFQDFTTRNGRESANDPVSQQLEKAVFRLKNGHSEARIDLRPETLGRVRMQITTENHQVTLRIMAEVPAVKEMLENNIGQLRADLQAHGLEIDTLEISVSGDDRNPGRNHREGGARRSGLRTERLKEPGQVDEAAATPAAEPVEDAATGIDYFA